MTENTHNFAFIGGHDPGSDAPTRAEPVGSELETLMDAIAVMTNWRRRSPYRCSVIRQENGRIDQYELQVWPGMASYHCVNVQTRAVDSYDAATGDYVSANERRDLEPNQFMTEPLAARLAFPISLGVWGRPSDSYRMIGASRLGDEILIRLEHQTDPHLFGSVTIDTEKRLVTRLDTPTETCRYQDVEMGDSHP